ncbi:Kinase-like protein [Mycena sanguinolenta]|uniref:Kinase-like protein n=1 Tax=Mycena sanguinolenta TaxID=230812 RepID=A0A8H6XUH4_9AGAR|nr:Kinase-like protein [Mycena sanguinolenta]
MRRSERPDILPGRYLRPQYVAAERASCPYTFYLSLARSPAFFNFPQCTSSHSASLALASVASAANILVTVGGNGTTTYSPSNVTANQGDVVVFQFVAGNHTATQSTFKAPCTEMAGGINSNFQFVASGAAQNPEWNFTVLNATTPLWFFCAQTGHCGKGMVFSVNAPPTGNTFDAFQTAAKATANTTSTSSSSSPSGTGAPSSALITRTSAGLLAAAAGVVAGLLL